MLFYLTWEFLLSKQHFHSVYIDIKGGQYVYINTEQTKKILNEKKEEGKGTRAKEMME